MILSNCPVLNKCCTIKPGQPICNVINTNKERQWKFTPIVSRYIPDNAKRLSRTNVINTDQCIAALLHPCVTQYIQFFLVPSGIWVRIPLPYGKSQLNGVLLMEMFKTDALCHSRCGTIKIPPCSKVVNDKRKFCIPHPHPPPHLWG